MMASRGWPPSGGEPSHADAASFVGVGGPRRASHLPMAMSYALPRASDGRAGPRSAAAAVFAWHALAGGDPNKDRATDVAALGYTLRGIASLEARADRSPPTSPMLSPRRTMNGSSSNLARLASTSMREAPTPLKPMSLSSVALWPGHVAASFQGGRVFCVFDAVSEGSDLAAADQERLRAFLRRAAAEGPQAKDDTFTPTSGHMLALRTVDSTIVAMIFVGAPEGVPAKAAHRSSAHGSNGVSKASTVTPLRLLIVQQNGSFLIWEYALAQASSSMQWQYVARGVLPSPARVPAAGASPAAATRIITKAVFHARTQTLAWFEKLPAATASSPHAFFSTQLSPLADSQLPDVLPSTVLVRSGYSCITASDVGAPSVWAAQSGFFVAPLLHGRNQLSLLYYFSLQNHQLLRVPVCTADGVPIDARSSAATAVFAVHPHSRQLYAADATRRLLSFREQTIDAADSSVNVYDASLYVQVTVECVLRESAVQPKVTKPTMSKQRSSLPPVAPPVLLAPTSFELAPGSQLAVFRQYLCLMQPTSSNSSGQSLNCTFFTLVAGLHLASLPLDVARNRGDLQDDDDDLAAPETISLVSATQGFGGGICAHTQRGIWWLRIGHIANQVQAITKKSASVPDAAPHGAMVISQATKDLNKLVRAADTLIPAVTALLPPSIASSPAVSGQHGFLPSLSALDSPLISGQSSFLSESLATASQSHLACQVLAPLKDSVAPLHTKHQVGRLLAKLVAKADARLAKHDAQRAAERLTHVLKLAEDNKCKQLGEGDEMKEGEGGGEGQQRQEMGQSKSLQATKHQVRPSVYDAALSPTDASWYPPIFRSLQSPALGISIFHLATSVPCAFSQPTSAPVNPVLLTPAFATHTYDAAYERVMREQIEQYLATMAPVNSEAQSRRRKKATEENGRSSTHRARGAHEHSNDSDYSRGSSASSSGSTTPRSTSPGPSPTASMLSTSSSFSSPAAGASIQSPRALVKNCFQRYTPLSLQTLPLIQQYDRVMRALRRMKHGATHKSLQRQVSGVEEGKEGELSGTSHLHTNGDVVSVGGSYVTSHSAHPATFIPPLPSLQQQLTKATTNRLTHLTATSSSLSALSCLGERSFTSLVIHDSQMSLNYLIHLLGLQGLAQQAWLHQQQEATETPEALSAVPDVRVRPNLLLVNEETQIRKILLSSMGMSDKESGSASSSLIHYPTGSSTSTHLDRLDALPYFETLVRLFDELAPLLLVEFVRINAELFSVGTRATSGPVALKSATDLLTPIEMEAHVERALRILPPILSTRQYVQRSRSQSNARVPMETGETSMGSTSDSYPDDDEKKQAGAVDVSVDPAQSAAEQLRLDRITARCSLLVLSGRPIEAVLLRLKMAVDEGDSSQEEAAIALAKDIVHKQEQEEYKRMGSLFASSTPVDDDDFAPYRPVLPVSSPTHALRAEMFHHLLTYWLQRQFHRQYNHARARASVDPSGVVSSFFPPLPSLDPRISALIPSRYPVATYLDIVAKEKIKFSHELQDIADEVADAKKSQQREAMRALASPTAELQWPTASPLLLPSPATLQLDATRASALVDLPMSCLLPELRHFAAAAAQQQQ